MKDFNSWLTAFVGTIPPTPPMGGNVVALRPKKAKLPVPASKYAADATRVALMADYYAALVDLCRHTSVGASSPAIREMSHSIANEMEQVARAHRLAHWANVCRHAKTGDL